MTNDHDITEFMLYAGGDRMDGMILRAMPFVWDDNWLVVSNQSMRQRGKWNPIAVQFYRRPERERYDSVRVS